jgi:hypothetical protein
MMIISRDSQGACGNEAGQQPEYSSIYQYCCGGSKVHVEHDLIDCYLSWAEINFPDPAPVAFLRRRIHTCHFIVNDVQ